ncbi:MAG: histidine phosphatase family protein [Chloroflexi bacterium]|nr:histidine phosphatase family protein [Chloroflexota bacterium]
MGRWHLVRHGRTSWNADGRLQGHSDTPLGEEGRRQVQRLAARLSGKRFTAIYASDLTRAFTTAEILSGGRIAPVPVRDLRETKHGVWEGLTFAEAQVKYPVEYARFMQSPDSGFAAPGGESILDVSRRVSVVMERIRSAHREEDDLLIVGHSGSVKVLAFALLGLPLAYYWRVRTEPASLSIINVQQGAATLELWNDTSHLEERHGE